MPWVCDHPRCDRVTKGFRNGRKLCHVCRMAEQRHERRWGRRCTEPGCAKPIASSASTSIIRCATCARKSRECSLTDSDL